MTFIDEISTQYGVPDSLVDGLLRYYRQFKQTIDEEARVGNENTLDITLGSGLTVQTLVNGRTQKNVAEVIVQIRADWYVAFQAAQNYDWDGEKHYRLIWLLLSYRELGVVTHPENGEVVTPDGKFWSDLPYLVKDAAQFQQDAIQSSTEAQRRNFAAFLAKLASVGVCNNQFAGCLLTLFRFALETDRPWEAGEESSELPVTHFMSMVEAWIQYGHLKIDALSVQSYKQGFEDENVFGPGPLAIAAGVSEVGFSPKRWQFWRDRLVQLGSLHSGGWAFPTLQCAGKMECQAEMYKHVLDIPPLDVLLGVHEVEESDEYDDMTDD